MEWVFLCPDVWSILVKYFLFIDKMYEGLVLNVEHWLITVYEITFRLSRTDNRTFNEWKNTSNNKQCHDFTKNNKIIFIEF